MVPWPWLKGGPHSEIGGPWVGLEFPWGIIPGGSGSINRKRRGPGFFGKGQEGRPGAKRAPGGNPRQGGPNFPFRKFWAAGSRPIWGKVGPFPLCWRNYSPLWGGSQGFPNGKKKGTQPPKFLACFSRGNPIGVPKSLFNFPFSPNLGPLNFNGFSPKGRGGPLWLRGFGGPPFPIWARAIGLSFPKKTPGVQPGPGSSRVWAPGV